jgi:hypothetical protein
VAPEVNTCPHCRSPACLPLWRKLTLGATFALYATWVPLMPDELVTPSMVETARTRIAGRIEPPEVKQPARPSRRR